MIAVLACLALGALLGLRVSVWVLLPAIALIIAMNVAAGSPVWFGLLTVLAPQIGYLLTAIIVRLIPPHRRTDAFLQVTKERTP